jgi:hypothetical protein
MPKRTQDWSPKKGGTLRPPREISDVEDVRRFFRSLLRDHDLNFHPDTDFRDYITYGTGEPFYRKRDAIRLNKLMTQAHQAVPDVYQIAVEEFERFEKRRRR